MEDLVFLKSSQYPGIEYEAGEEIFLSPQEAGTSFYLDVDEELTSNDAAMALVASTLDDADGLLATAKEFLKKTLSSDDASYHGAVAYFMEYHRDQLDPDALVELFPSCNAKAMSFEQMVDFLKIVRFGSLFDEETGQQAFVLDLSFNPELTDELLVIYFDLEKQVVSLAHES